MKGESAAKPGGGRAPLEQTNRILYHRDHDDDDGDLGAAQKC